MPNVCASRPVCSQEPCFVKLDGVTVAMWFWMPWLCTPILLRGFTRLKIEYVGVLFLVTVITFSRLGRKRGQLIMFSHCRGYAQSLWKSGAFWDSIEQTLEMSTPTHATKCKPSFVHSVLSGWVTLTIQQSSVAYRYTSIYLGCVKVFILHTHTPIWSMQLR